ncbi:MULTISPECIES: hypothetical protein [Clostridium]|uniref:Uncharacterized protein n=1 Tax=Clostridium butyricum TaxID=1492 RepID=A0A0A6PW70_CLOBU|nr:MULTISPECIES: hypothetical protein [Clostridium]MDU4854906.1 hypothetical protein [Clostridioides difficile]KHD13294.1 hypothetical protein OA81_21560 [Clostridium butyricum]KHD14687.1 hypothetical protein OA81_13480 [Clostridium butyricum]MBS4843147.1 hypothetical protein [Clostridium sp.]MBZ5747158.1 hypothetical protein [Clostridium butyricum]
MEKWGFIEWFGVISGAASMVSLIMAIFIKNDVVKIKNNINNSFNDSSDTTFGNESPVQKHYGQGNNSYKGGN